MKRNCHPFAGNLARAKEAGGVRLWTARGGEWVNKEGTHVGTRKSLFLPVRPMIVCATVKDLDTANKVLARIAKGTKIYHLGWRGARWHSQTGTWWMVTE